MPNRTPFPLRFEEDSVREALKEASDQTGVSMNRIAQDAIAVHLDIVTRVLQERLERSMAALQRYRGHWSENEMRAFARAEVEYPDPIEGRMVDEQSVDDPFGVKAAFAHPVER